MKRRAHPRTLAGAQQRSSPMFNSKHLSLSLTILLPACQHDDPPDLAQISKDYCAIVQTCDPNEPWEDQEGCEADSAQEFEKARTSDKKCFDTRIVMETCIGKFETCDEYDKFQHDNDGDCLHEFMDFYVACMLP